MVKGKRDMASTFSWFEVLLRTGALTTQARERTYIKLGRRRASA